MKKNTGNILIAIVIFFTVVFASMPLFAMVGEESEKSDTSSVSKSSQEKKGYVEGSKRNARYVGVASCEECHIDKKIGDQYDIWLRAGHPRAWVMLQSSVAKIIAEKAGVKGDPQKSEVCLACHAAKARVDKVYIEPTFKFEDGIQCESCHGPASDHIASEKNKAIATKSHLKRLTKDDCMMCHKEKPSHAILKLEKFDFEKMWKKIAHPVPK